MAISFVSSASAAATSFTMPTHQTGDLLLVGAFRSNNATFVVEPPLGWVTLDCLFSSNNHSYLFSKIAQSNAEVSGTFANADGICCCVYRSDQYLLECANATFSQHTVGSGGSISYLAPLTDSQITNRWFGALVTSRANDSDCEVAPSGMTNRVSQICTSPTGELAMHDTDGNVAGWTTTNYTLTSGTTARVLTATYEIAETGQSLAAGGGVRIPNIRGGADQ